MDRLQAQQNEELIEIGAASVETMGSNHGSISDDGANHYYPTLGAGLADD